LSFTVPVYLLSNCQYWNSCYLKGSRTIPEVPTQIYAVQSKIGSRNAFC